MSADDTTRPHICIVGGGIGGLALAIGLHKAGVRFDLYEAAPSFGEIGAGVAFAKNARRALSLLGLTEEYNKHATLSDNGVFFEFRDGETRDAELITTKRHHGPYGPSSIHRAVLVDILARQVPSNRAHFDKRLLKIEDIDLLDPAHTNTIQDGHLQRQGHRMRLHFADGTTQDTDVVVGCDGIRSVVRPSVVADAKLEWTGTWAYRAVLTRQKLIEVVGQEKADHYIPLPQMFCGRDRHALIFAIDHGQTMNLVAFKTDRSQYPERPSFPPGEPWTQPASTEEMLAAFDGFNDDVLGMLKVIESPNKWALHQLIPALSTYVNDQICLLGDAAHGGTPHQGAMAGQALEDAVVLAAVLSRSSLRRETVSQALQVYDTMRRPRANRVLETSLENGDVVECAGAWAAGAEAIRKDAETRYDWIWEHDVSEDVRRVDDMLGV